MKNLVKLCSIVSLVVSAIGMAIKGILSETMVVFFIIVGIIFMLGNRTLYIIAAAIAALVIFIKFYGGTATAGQYNLLQGILTLAIIVFAIYYMLRSVFPASRQRNNYKKSNFFNR